MDMVTVPKLVVDLLAQVQKYGAIARASELQEVYRLVAAHSDGRSLPLSKEQKAALDLAVLNLKTHGDDQLLSAVTPLIEYYKSTAHSAGAQEPEGYFQWDDVRAIYEQVSPMHAPDADVVPLYTQPQPMPQTDAARDALLRAKQMLEGYAGSYKRMGQDSTSRGGDGRITCTAVMYDIRDNMVGWIDAEIERIERAKGE